MTHCFLSPFSWALRLLRLGLSALYHPQRYKTMQRSKAVDISARIRSGTGWRRLATVGPAIHWNRHIRGGYLRNLYSPKSAVGNRVHL